MLDVSLKGTDLLSIDMFFIPILYFHQIDQAYCLYFHQIDQAYCFSIDLDEILVFTSQLFPGGMSHVKGEETNISLCMVINQKALEILTSAVFAR